MYIQKILPHRLQRCPLPSEAGHPSSSWCNKGSQLCRSRPSRAILQCHYHCKLRAPRRASWPFPVLIRKCVSVTAEQNLHMFIDFRLIAHFIIFLLLFVVPATGPRPRRGRARARIWRIRARQVCGNSVRTGQYRISRMRCWGMHQSYQ